MYVFTDRSKVIIVFYSHSYYNTLSWVGGRKKNDGVIATSWGIPVEMCCTIECHLWNVSHLKKMVRSLPNGKNGWVNRWSQCRLSGKCYDRSMCTRSWDSQDKSYPQESFLRRGSIELCFRGRKRILEAANGGIKQNDRKRNARQEMCCSSGREGWEVVMCV